MANSSPSTGWGSDETRAEAVKWGDPVATPYRNTRDLLPIVVGTATAYAISDVALQALGPSHALAPTVAVVSVFATFGAVISGILWWHRVATNVANLSAQAGRMGRVWSWLGWLIPVAQWIIPYWVASEIWRASEPNDSPDASAAQDGSMPAPSLLRGWWALWVSATVVGGIFSYQGIGTDLAADEALPPLTRQLGILASVLLVATLPLYIKVVRTIQARMDAKWDPTHSAGIATS